VTRTPVSFAVLAFSLLASAAGAGGIRALAVDVYEVYTELTVALAEPAPFTCEAGAEPHTLVLTVGAEAPKDLAAEPAGRLAGIRVARAKGATTFVITTVADVGTFRAYVRREPAAVVVDVYRKLDLGLAPRESAAARFLRGRKLLLVDDDDGPGNGNQYSVDVDGKYTGALERLDIPYDVYVVRTGRDGPPAAKLAEYPLVVWFNGLDARPVVISRADEAAMASYVEGGGRLLLVSQNYLSDASKGRTPFCRETLGIASYTADTQVAEVAVGGGISLPRPAYLLSNDLTVIGNWGDGFRAPAGAAVLFTGPEDGLCYGMARAAGSGKVAFFSFALENVGYVNRIADILEATVAELSED
jgi:hypothetical protein